MNRDSLVGKIRDAIAMRHPDTPVEQAAADVVLAELQRLDDDKERVQNRLTLELTRTAKLEQTVLPLARTSSHKAVKDATAEWDTWEQANREF